jgi:hypothetical protein
MLFAEFAKLFHFQTLFQGLLIFASEIIGMLAFCALHFDKIFSFF